jgi:hypothetical protein
MASLVDDDAAEQLLEHYDGTETIKLIPIDDTNEWIYLNRKDAIEKLGADVATVKTLFDDLRELVEQQQEPINQIEININSTKDNVDKGNVELVQAEQLQKSYAKTWSLLTLFAGGTTIVLISLLRK